MSDLRLPLRWAGCLAVGSGSRRFRRLRSRTKARCRRLRGKLRYQPAPPAFASPPASPTPLADSGAPPGSDCAAPANSAVSSRDSEAAPQWKFPAALRIPLVLHNGISTHSAKVGDPVYFETLFPIMIDGHVAIPAGSYVSGEVTETKRAGRVKGRGELMIKLNTLILTNGYMVNLERRSAQCRNGRRRDGGQRRQNRRRFRQSIGCRHDGENDRSGRGNRRHCHVDPARVWESAREWAPRRD